MICLGKILLLLLLQPVARDINLSKAEKEHRVQCPCEFDAVIKRSLSRHELVEEKKKNHLTAHWGSTFLNVAFRFCKRGNFHFNTGCAANQPSNFHHVNRSPRFDYAIYYSNDILVHPLFYLSITVLKKNLPPRRRDENLQRKKRFYGKRA